MSEFLDIFDDNYQPIFPYKLTKEAVHSTGAWHHTFHCFILDKNTSSLYFQLNRKKNNLFKPILTPSSAGHIQSGETVKDGVREMKEELGLDVNVQDLKYIGVQKRIVDYPENNYHDREFIHVFFLKQQIDEKNIHLDIDEVKGFFKINIDDGLKLFSEHVEKISISGRELEYNQYRPKQLTVGISDFVKQPPNYYLNLFNEAKKLLNSLV